MKNDFSILPSDRKADHSYEDVQNCPLFHAFKRQFPNIPLKLVLLSGVYNSNGARIAILDRSFLSSDYLNLCEGKEFHTKITIDA